MQVALVYGRLRPEERLLMEAGQRLGIAVRPVHDATMQIGSAGGVPGDVALVRSISTSRGLAVMQACEAAGQPVVNEHRVAALCADKAHTSWRLRAAGVPTPETRVAFTPEAALDALEVLGYPAVLKPVTGSWARLVSRVRDRAEAEQVLEHRAMLPNPSQHIYYAQQYVEKANDDGRHRDLRAFVVGADTIACIARVADHWITNTARGATTQAMPVDDELDDICQRAAEAVGGGILAMDLMQTRDGLVVHEVNHTMEFRNSIAPTGVDIPGQILRHCVEVARR